MKENETNIVALDVSKFNIINDLKQKLSLHSVLAARNENTKNPYGPVPPELTDAQSPQSTLCVYPRLGQLVLQYTPLAYTS